MVEKKQMIKTFTMLRLDAIEKGLMDAAIVHGWSAIRLGIEHLEEIEYRVRSMKA
jgi:hypothetical protein